MQFSWDKTSCIYHPVSGDEGIRTHDPLLARQVLSQLSYTPKVLICLGKLLSLTNRMSYQLVSFYK